jgi:hypothetical protein
VLPVEGEGDDADAVAVVTNTEVEVATDAETPMPAAEFACSPEARLLPCAVLLVEAPDDDDVDSFCCDDELLPDETSDATEAGCAGFSRPPRVVR